MKKIIFITTLRLSAGLWYLQIKAAPLLGKNSGNLIGIEVAKPPVYGVMEKLSKIIEEKKLIFSLNKTTGFSKNKI